MEWTFEAEKINDTTIKIISEEFNLSPWTYNIRIGNKWFILFVDNREINFNRIITHHFNNEEKLLVHFTIDINEYKKLNKINMSSGSGFGSGSSSDSSETIEKLEKSILLKTKQIDLLNIRIEQLENKYLSLEKLLKNSLGF